MSNNQPHKAVLTSAQSGKGTDRHADSTTDESAATQIKRRGFTVIPGFLDAPAVAGFAGNYRDGGTLDNKMYSLGMADANKVEAIKPAIRELLDEIREGSGIDINFIGGGVFFATERGIDFSWHQDHESFFMHQTHRNYLNLYIPVIKPVREKTNLSIIPADNFAERSPGLWAKLENGGASGAAFRQGRTTITNDCHGGVHGTLDYDIEELSETPELAAGDALLLRGDIFHRTQDTQTSRVALSIRMFNDVQTVTRRHFEQSCPVKNAFMERNSAMYERIGRVFADHESLTFRQLMTYAYGV